ncbi:MAG: hypothetical protein ACRD2N_25575 [Vicinamibacterales bacterium]
MRALSASGEQKWVEAAPGQPVMGDSFGGVVTFIPDGDGTPAGLARVAGPTSAPPWRYEPTGAVGRPAQASDGTIYAIEKTWSGGYAFPDLSAVVINGNTGRLIARVALPRDFVEFTSELDGQIINGIGCNSGYGGSAPHVSDPVVGSDGAAYFQFRRITRVDYGYCDQPDISRVDHRSLQLVKITPTGTATFTSLYEYTGPNTAWWPSVGQTVPDGLGGTLATWSRHQVSGPVEGTLSRLAANGTRIDLSGESTILMTGDTGPLVGDAGTAYVYRNELLEALDVATLTSKWTVPWTGHPVMALDGGGVAVHDQATGNLMLRDALGQPMVTSAMPIEFPTSVVRQGEWAGVVWNAVIEAAVLESVVGPIVEKARDLFQPVATGNPQGQNQMYSTCEIAPFTPNWKGLTPGSTVTYSFVGTWLPERKFEIIAAFDLWSLANQKSGLHTTFVELSTGTPVLTLRNIFLPPQNNKPTAAGILGGYVVDSGGNLLSATIAWTTNTALLSNWRGYRTTALHEIGHTLGLDDTSGTQGSSVMNQLGDKDDGLKKVSIYVTPCDRHAAWLAQFQIF